MQWPSKAKKGSGNRAGDYVFNLDPVKKKIQSLIKSLPYVVAEGGLLSRSKKLFPKKFFNIDRPARGRPSRDPGRTLIRSGRLERLQERFAEAGQKAVVKYFAAERGRPLKILKGEIGPAVFPSFKKAYQASFGQTGPALSPRTMRLKGSSQALVETGQLRQRGVLARWKSGRKIKAELKK